ncbi:hypothetical protein ACFC08_39890 [Streptomyces sp. NPDC056112]|uniref:hypothetical protein n=1 Tax=unclassified Streptomyces TaxID=2593676 RepID=UPI00155A0960|nr:MULTISPECIES: hypothetical protein [unclassified Streptomyces]
MSRSGGGGLAIVQLDYAARNWTPGRWGGQREQLVDAIAESWTGLLSRELTVTDDRL